MQLQSLIRWVLVSLGIALLLAGLFFEAGTAGSVRPQATAVNTLTAIQRLAEPTLPASATQADFGAQDYWLYCLPCHGDRGQGLTEEFRQTYPPEEVYCWEGGCHGDRPYEDGFKLPMNVPAVIGPGTLQKFPTAAVLRSYIFAAMPYWNPGSLEEAQTWRITAFLLRANGLWTGGEELNASNAGSIPVRPPPLTPTPQAVVSTSTTTILPLFVGLLAFLVILFVLRAFRKKMKNQ
jgi:hypothetical protein